MSFHGRLKRFGSNRKLTKTTATTAPSLSSSSSSSVSLSLLSTPTAAGAGVENFEESFTKNIEINNNDSGNDSGEFCTFLTEEQKEKARKGKIRQGQRRNERNARKNRVIASLDQIAGFCDDSSTENDVFDDTTDVTSSSTSSFDDIPIVSTQQQERQCDDQTSARPSLLSCRQGSKFSLLQRSQSQHTSSKTNLMDKKFLALELVRSFSVSSIHCDSFQKNEDKDKDEDEHQQNHTIVSPQQKCFRPYEQESQQQQQREQSLYNSRTFGNGSIHSESYLDDSYSQSNQKQPKRPHQKLRKNKLSVTNYTHYLLENNYFDMDASQKSASSSTFQPSKGGAKFRPVGSGCSIQSESYLDDGGNNNPYDDDDSIATWQSLQQPPPQQYCSPTSIPKYTASLEPQQQLHQHITKSFESSAQSLDYHHPSAIAPLHSACSSFDNDDSISILSEGYLDEGGQPPRLNRYG